MDVEALGERLLHAVFSRRGALTRDGAEVGRITGQGWPGLAADKDRRAASTVCGVSCHPGAGRPTVTSTGRQKRPARPRSVASVAPWTYGCVVGRTGCAWKCAQITKAA